MSRLHFLRRDVNLAAPSASSALRRSVRQASALGTARLRLCQIPSELHDSLQRRPDRSRATAEQEMLRFDVVRRRSASSAAKLSTRVVASANGISTEVGNFSPRVTRCSIFNRNSASGIFRLANSRCIPLESRRSPSSRCAGSIVAPPSWPSSYREKKRTRRARSE